MTAHHHTTRYDEVRDDFITIDHRDVPRTPRPSPLTNSAELELEARGIIISSKKEARARFLHGRITSSLLETCKNGRRLADFSVSTASVAGGITLGYEYL